MACDHVMPGYVMELAPAPSEALPTPAPQQAVLSVPALPVEATATEDSEAGLGMDVGVRAKIQAVLAKRGAKLADVGGLFGDDTRAAIKSWQGGQGALATGYLAAGERDALLAEFRNKGPLAFPYFLRLTVDDLGPSPEPRLVKAVEALSHYPIRYVYVGGELFIDVIAFGIDWKGSKELAERAGGRLAIISSAAVNDAVVKLLEGNRSYYQIYENPHRGKSYNGPWIGLSRDPSQPPPFAGWHWIDGSKVAYRKWAEGQPLVWAPDVTDDCAHLIGPLSTDPKIYAHTNKWASVNCEYIYNSLVIEVPK